MLQGPLGVQYLVYGCVDAQTRLDRDQTPDLVDAPLYLHSHTPAPST